MLAGLVMAVLVLGLTRLSTAHLWLSTRSNTALKVSSLVNSVTSITMAKLLEKPTYGAADPDIVLENDAGNAVVTFSPQRAQALSIPYSTNNLEGTAVAEGYEGRTVAPGTVLVIGSCNVGGMRRTVEAVLRLPPFPWAIVSGGTLKTQDKVLIGSIPAGQWPPPPEDELLPADILANAATERAIVLSGDCSVLGDVESPGGIVLEGEEVRVKGEVRPGVDPIHVPELRASQYDPEVLGLDYDGLEQLDPSASEVLIQGTARKRGNLEVNGLRLEGGNLYVDGDLMVRGSVTGRGTLVCSGHIDIQGLTLDSATELALLADGRVDLRGAGQAGSSVRGLFYAGDGLSARDLTVAGTVVAGRGVSLDNVNVLHEELPTAGPSGETLYFGKREPGASEATLGGVTSEKPVYEHGFSIRLESDSPNSQFPLTLTVGPGFAFDDSKSWRVSDSAALTRLLTMKKSSDLFVFFSKKSKHGQMLYAKNQGIKIVGPTTPRRNYTENAFLYFSNQVQAATRKESMSAMVIRDLSKFLPIEERVRVISWIER